MNSFGSFYCNSGELIISDPSFEKESINVLTIKNVFRGKFYCYGDFTKEPDNIYIVTDKKYMNKYEYTWKLNSNPIRVDTGLIGIYDKQFYQDNDHIFDPSLLDKYGTSFYGHNAEIATKYGKGILPKKIGVVYNTKKADNVYFQILRTGGMTVGIRFYFPTEDDVKKLQGRIKRRRERYRVKPPRYSGEGED